MVQGDYQVTRRIVTQGRDVVGSSKDGFDEVVAHLRSIDKPITRLVLGVEMQVDPQVFDPMFQDSQFLARWARTMVKSGQRVLDMGTGCGVQAVFAAENASEVVAVDVNPFAVKCAQANVRRNGLRNVDVRRSDLFGDLEDDRFDVIVWNPPFYDRQPMDWTERACGDAGHATLERFLGTARNHLRQDGFVLMVTSESLDANVFSELIGRNKLKGRLLDEMFNIKRYSILAIQ